MRGFGALAEYASVPADVLAGKPANLTFDDTAALPVAALTALQGLRDHARVEPDRQALLAERGPGSDPVPGGGTRSGKGGHLRLTPAPFGVACAWGSRPCASAIRLWTIMAAAVEPAATAFATEGICEVTSPPAKRPGTLV